MTLKDVWEAKRLYPVQVAAQAGISLATLYKINRKEHVATRSLAAVRNVLEITQEQLETLDAALPRIRG